MDRRRVAGAGLDRDVCSRLDPGRHQNEFPAPIRRRSVRVENPVLTQVGRGPADRVAQHACCATRPGASSARSVPAPTSPSGIRPSRRCEQAEERMRFALEARASGSGTWTTPPGSLRWSEILEAQYGLQPGTFGGTFEAFIERVHPDDRESVLETIGKAMQSGGDFSILHRTIWPDGTVRWLSGAGRVLLGEHGEPVRAVGISLDVTERHTLEAAVSAGAEDGSHRTAGRRRGPRLQQSADRDSGVLRAVAGRSQSGRSAPGRHYGDSEGRHACRGAHAPVAGLQPQGDHPAHAARPERDRGRHPGDAGTPHRGRRDDRAGPRASAGAREGRSRAGRADRPEPRGERAGCHAERRHVDDRRPPTSNSTSTTRRRTSR